MSQSWFKSIGLKKLETYIFICWVGERSSWTKNSDWTSTVWEAFVGNTLSPTPFPLDPEFICSCGGQCLYAQSASFFRHWGLSPVKRSLLDCVRGTQKDLWLNTPRGNPETLRGQSMLTHPLLPMFQWDNPEACVYRVPQRFPGRLSSICSQWSPAYQYAFYWLIFLPISIVYPLTSYSCLPASSPSEVPTPARCRVCLGGVQPKY